MNFAIKNSFTFLVLSAFTQLSFQLSSQELDRFLSLVNNLRASNRAPPVCYNGKLMAASERHSKDQDQRNVMSHDGYGGSSPFDRMKAAGFAFSSASENVAGGQVSVDNVFLDWKNSPGHLANMIDQKITMIGLARSGRFWTMDMARPLGYESCIKNSNSVNKQPSPSSSSPPAPNQNKKNTVQPSHSENPDRTAQVHSKEPAQPQTSKKSLDYADLEIPNFDALVKSIQDRLKGGNIDLALLSDLLQDNKQAKDAPYVSAPTTKEKDVVEQIPTPPKQNGTLYVGNKNESNSSVTEMPPNGSVSADARDQNDPNILSGAENYGASSSFSVFLLVSFLMPVFLSIME